MPDTTMPPTLRFMLAARRSELEGLKGLAQTCQQVSLITQLVHALQRERGYSNLYLGTHTDAHRQQLEKLSDDARRQEREVLEGLQRMDLQEASASDRARLFNRIAFVLHCFEELPGLRRRILAHQLSPLDATAGLTRLIGGLLAVIFEAADSAIDPTITRALVALFNFMQGKELAGQERATGVTGFGSGYFSDALKSRLEHLGQSQERSFQHFVEFADDSSCERWQTLQAGAQVAQVLRLRAMALRTSTVAPVDAMLSELWFELSTQRIDAMRPIEAHLAEHLLALCGASIRQANADLDNHRSLLERLVKLDAVTSTDQARLFNVQASQLDSPATDALGPQLERSLLDLLQAQTQRLQQANDELEQARHSLNERKLLERAKSLLMRRHGLSENEAHGRLRQSAMDRGERLIDVAQKLINAAENKD